MSLLRATLSDVGPFRNLVTLLGECVQDALFTFTEDGLFVQVCGGFYLASLLGLSHHVQAMDNCHISLVQHIMPPSAFEEYRCSRPANLGIRIPAFVNTLKFGGVGDTLELNCDEDADTLSVTMRREGRSADLQLYLMNIAWDMLEIPPVKYECHAYLPCDEVSGIITHMQQSGDTLTVSFSPGQVTFSSKGDTHQGAITVNPERMLCEVEVLAQDFQTRLLGWLKHAAKIGDEVQMLMKDGCPLEFRVNARVGGKFIFFLAPKIRDEEL